jgi:hypothetical protein
VFVVVNTVPAEPDTKLYLLPASVNTAEVPKVLSSVRVIVEVEPDKRVRVNEPGKMLSLYPDLSIDKT